MVKLAAKDPMPTSYEGYAAQAHAIRTFDRRHELAQVRTPTLVLVGAEDVLTPPGQSIDMARRIPGAELVILPAAATACSWNSRVPPYMPSRRSSRRRLSPAAEESHAACNRRHSSANGSRSGPGCAAGLPEAAEALGYTHLLAYDHVLGADPDVHQGWEGRYDIDTTFHEPLVLFGYLAALTDSDSDWRGDPPNANPCWWPSKRPKWTS